MTTPVFDGFATQCIVESAHEGSKPVFVSKKNYDSRGFEKKEPVKPGAAPPEEQSFFSKYWLYILLAFFILPRLLEAPEGEGGAQGGGGGGQSQA